VVDPGATNSDEMEQKRAHVKAFLEKLEGTLLGYVGEKQIGIAVQKGTRPVGEPAPAGPGVVRRVEPNGKEAYLILVDVSEVQKVAAGELLQLLVL
jgi:hypothetical protein